MEHAKLLATFSLTETKEIFNIYGEYEIETGASVDMASRECQLVHYKYPNFYNMVATKVVDGKEESYCPSGESWTGEKYTASDMAGFLISALIVGDMGYEKIYLEEGLQELVDDYTKDVVVTVDGKDIPRKILTNDMFSLYQLNLVTDLYFYYGCDDSMVMYDISEHSVISDNYFAEYGYMESLEHIACQEETLLWELETE